MKTKFFQNHSKISQLFSTWNQFMKDIHNNIDYPEQQKEHIREFYEKCYPKLLTFMAENHWLGDYVEYLGKYKEEFESQE